MAGSAMSGAELALRQRRLVEGAVELWAEAILHDAILEAPVDEGTLRGSGHIEESPVGLGPDVIAREVSFTTPYAARQHEETTWNHPKGGKAKYLSDPLKARAYDGQRLIQAAVTAGTRLGGGLFLG